MNRPSRRSRHPKGFTLVELTIVLVIVALLTSGMIISFSTQKDINDSSETLRQLNTINDALLGFAATNQRMPCPASTASDGRESFCTDGNPASACGTELYTPQPHGRCSVPFTGFLPAATLGIAPTDANGFAVDRWNNRIRYAISHDAGATPRFQFTAASTTTSGLKMAWAGNTLGPDLRICAQAACTTVMTANAVAALLSPGKNGSGPAAGADETENQDGDTTFVSRTPSQDFDDIVVWLSPNLLYNRLIASGRLP